LLEAEDLDEQSIGDIRAALKLHPDLKIVCICSKATPADLAAISAEIPVRFLAKPFAPADLFNALR
jgi:hypothetical protein